MLQASEWHIQLGSMKCLASYPYVPKHKVDNEMTKANVLSIFHFSILQTTCTQKKTQTASDST